LGSAAEFHYRRQTDGIFLRINIVFLLTIGFIPFSMSLTGEYPFFPTVVRFYGANLAATGLALNAIWWYTTNNHRLVEKDLYPPISLGQRRTIVGPIVCLIGIGFSYLDKRISLALYLLLIPILHAAKAPGPSFQGASHS
jgi:uncharacterized membrane protein